MRQHQMVFVGYLVFLLGGFVHLYMVQDVMKFTGIFIISIILYLISQKLKEGDLITEEEEIIGEKN